ncbi:sulfite exporter TauE/SafE family protein [Salibacterium salarium]|uniref:Probable membrane transporter protein n=1 Tax=Salibacterium salarium TaxID=284579 RepID=A0A428N513_9BACI|nr:sulfite exporter TauE/SafE family protein [Salibacterium salarium]RSL33342.1 sulfite exporter TauE/SafE family protein [Salibacterium salarium]
MFDLGLIHIALIIGCALLIGISKTGLPTLGILVVATMASIFPARESIGIVLPMLITADIIAVTYYRRSVNWKTLLSLLPWVLGGLLIGFIVLFFIEASRPIEIMLGIIILLMIGVQFSRERSGAKWMEAIPQSKWFVGVMGILAGFTTMIGNAAGPIMAIFLLAIALPKQEFIGTGAWFFLSVNLIKVPLYVGLGLITFESITFNLWLVPAILIGTYIGIKTLPYIPQKIFNIIILLLAVFGGLRLLIA